MVLVLVLGLVAVGLALIRGGSLERLAETKLRWSPLLFAMLFLQVTLDLWSPSWLTGAAALSALVATYVGVVAVLLVNRRHPGMVLASIGLFLNLVVISANGAMPVSKHALEVAGGPNITNAGVKHELIDGGSRLVWLSDVIPVPVVGQVISIGDVILAAGIAWFLYRQTRDPVGPSSPRQPRLRRPQPDPDRKHDRTDRI